MGVYCVGLVYQQTTKSEVITNLRHGIINAASKEEALGKFILEEKVDGSLTNKSVFEAVGYKYEPQQKDGE